MTHLCNRQHNEHVRDYDAVETGCIGAVNIFVTLRYKITYESHVSLMSHFDLAP